MARDKKNEKKYMSSQDYYDYAEKCVSYNQDHAKILTGIVSYWRSFCMGNKNAAFELLEFFYECKFFPLAYTFYEICMLIKHPKCSEYKNKIGVEKVVPYLECATSVYHRFMLSHDIIGKKSITDDQNIDLSTLYYNDVIMPDGMTLSHAVLSKINVEWDNGLTEMQKGLAPHFYNCSIDMLLFKCMHLTDDDDSIDESVKLLMGQDDGNSGCCCIVM